MEVAEQCRIMIDKMKTEKDTKNDEIAVFENAYDYLTDFKVLKFKECMITSANCNELAKSIEQSGDNSDRAILKIVLLQRIAKELKIYVKLALKCCDWESLKNGCIKAVS